MVVFAADAGAGSGAGRKDSVDRAACVLMAGAAGPEEYAVAFREATTRAAAAGFVLEQDVEEMVTLATAAYPA